MTIPKLKAAAWVDGEPLTPTQINQLNDLLPNLMDMVGGSSHTPTAKVVVGGAGMEISPLTIPQETNRIAVPLIPHSRVDAAASWRGMLEADGTPYFYQADTTGGNYIRLALPPLPRGCAITQVRATYQGSGHPSLPASMPELALRRQNPDTLAFEIIGYTSDTSGTTGAYDAAHGIALNLTPHNYDPYYLYCVTLVGESGANSQTNNMLKALTITVQGDQIHI